MSEKKNWAGASRPAYVHASVSLKVPSVPPAPTELRGPEGEAEICGVPHPPPASLPELNPSQAVTALPRGRSLDGLQ